MLQQATLETPIFSPPPQAGTGENCPAPLLQDPSLGVGGLPPVDPALLGGGCPPSQWID